MRELQASEIEQVSGGIFPVAAALGSAAVSGYVSYTNGGNLQTIVASSILGGLSGVAGGMARITTGIVSAKFGVQSAGLTIASGTITASGPGNDDVADHEKVLEK